MTRLLLGPANNSSYFVGIPLILALMAALAILLAYDIPRLKRQRRERDKLAGEAREELSSRIRIVSKRAARCISGILLGLILVLWIPYAAYAEFVEVRYDSSGVKLYYRLRPEPVSLHWRSIREIRVFERTSLRRPARVGYQMEIVTSKGSYWSHRVGSDERLTLLKDAAKQLRAGLATQSSARMNYPTP